MFTNLAEKLGESDHPPFDFAVIDEAQDVGVAQCDSSLPSGTRAPTGSSSPAILVSESSRSRFPGKLLVWMSGDGTVNLIAGRRSSRKADPFSVHGQQTHVADSHSPNARARSRR